MRGPSTLLLNLLAVVLVVRAAPLPAPAPLPPSVAQGLIAALTLAHASVIGYALHHEAEIQTFRFVGELREDVDQHEI